MSCKLLPANPNKLTDKEKAFVLGYIVHYDRTKAVLDAKYKCKTRTTASNLGSKLLRKPRVRALINLFQKKTQKKFEIQADEILWHVHACATRDGKQFVDENGVIIGSTRIVNGRVEKGIRINDLPEEVTSAIDGIKQKRKAYTLEDGTTVEEIETEIKLVPKAAALRMAMEHKGLFAGQQLEVLLMASESMFRRSERVDPIEQQVLDVQGRSIVEETKPK